MAAGSAFPQKLQMQPASCIQSQNEGAFSLLLLKREHPTNCAWKEHDIMWKLPNKARACCVWPGGGVLCENSRGLFLVYWSLGLLFQIIVLWIIVKNLIFYNGPLEDKKEMKDSMVSLSAFRTSVVSFFLLYLSLSLCVHVHSFLISFMIKNI